MLGEIRNGLVKRTLRINGVKVTAVMSKRWSKLIPSRVESIIKAKDSEVSKAAKCISL